MAVFPKFKITNKGLNYLNRSVAEKKALTFTKFKIGDGVPSGNWEELNDIVASFKEFPVLETSVQNNKVVRIKGYFDNKGLNADKKLKEIGVYATLEGVHEEILYSYTNAGDTADTVPDENNGFFSRTFDVANYIGNATQVTYTVEQITKDFDFNTVEEMKNATFLKSGDRVHLWGKTQLGDTTTKTLIITNTYSGNNAKYTLKNNKTAVVINDIDNKLDKGAYTGNAQDLKDEIDIKQDKLRKERILTDSDNLDDVVEVGDYRCANIGIEKFSSAEIPINSYYGYGLLKVRSLQTNSIYQEYTPISQDDQTYPKLYRFRWQSSSVWSNWTAILNYDSYPFLGALGTQYKITAIQKEGRKEAGKLYYDNVTGKIYKARISNNDKDVTSNFIDITNKGLSDKIESNHRKLLFSGGANTTTIPKHILEKYDYLYIHLENELSSKSPLPCFVEVEDLFSSNVSQLLFGVPNSNSTILGVGIVYSQSTGILKALGGYFMKIVGYKWYHIEED